MINKKNMIDFQNRLKQKNMTITCAESCTGGLISSKITSVSGSSYIFKGSVITYSNEIKEQELNVKKQTIINYGVVSVEVVNEMLSGVLNKFDASLAVAVSGVAGPNGGTKEKPVGTVVIGIKSKNYSNTKIYKFEGSRTEVQNQTVDMVFSILFDKF